MPEHASEAGADSSTKAKTLSWLDLLPAAAVPARDDLLTRDDVLAALCELGVAMSASSLEQLEYRGFLPRPLRSRRDNRPVALYPEIAVRGIARLRQLQDDGLPLREIRLVIPGFVRIAAAYDASDPAAQAAARAEPNLVDVVDAVDGGLTMLARWHERTHAGARLVRMRVVATEATGREFIIHDRGLDTTKDVV